MATRIGSVVTLVAIAFAALATVVGVLAGAGAATTAAVAGGAFLLAEALLLVAVFERRAPLFGRIFWRGPAHGGVVALTFDDGPNEPYTSQVLDILKTYGVKGTFFVVGENVERHSDAVCRAVAEGHEVGNHTMTHRVLPLKSPGAIRRELRPTSDLVEKVAGVRPRWFRAPHGWRNPWINRAARAEGLEPVAWSLGVWDTDRPGAEVIARRVRRGLRDGCVLLLHDGRGVERNADSSQLVEALPGILDDIQRRGFRCVTVSEMAARARRERGNGTRAKRRRVLRAGLMLAFMAAVAAALSRMNLHESWRAVEHIGWRWALCVALLNIVNTAVEAVRWKLVLTPVKKGVRARHTFGAILMGVLGNVVLPLKLGDGARAYAIADDERIGMWSAVSSVVFDRVVDVTIFLFILAATAVLFPLPMSVMIPGVVVAALLAAVLVAVFLSPRRFRGWGLRFRPAVRVVGWLFEQKERLLEALSTLGRSGSLLWIGLLGALSWLLRLAMVVAMFHALEFELPLVAGLVVLVFINVGVAVVNTPANLGGFEVAAVAALALFPVETPRALVYALALHMVEVLPIVAMGLVVFWRRGLTMRDLTSRARVAEQGSGETSNLKTGTRA